MNLLFINYIKYINFDIYILSNPKVQILDEINIIIMIII